MYASLRAIQFTSTTVPIEPNSGRSWPLHGRCPSLAYVVTQRRSKDDLLRDPRATCCERCASKRMHSARKIERR